MSRDLLWRLGIVVGFLVSIFFINSEADRTNFGSIAILYSLAFLFYILMIRKAASFDFSFLIIVAGLAQLASIIYEPNLSDDYYRFLWDVEMTWRGINVFDFKPIELSNESFMESSYMQEIYAGMTDLSKDNYSCYPPVNQVFFIISTGFSSSIALNVLIMKVLIVLTEVLGAIYLRKLFLHFSINPSRIWVLFLNPLFIIECTGNVHFEGVMISLLCISFYYLFINKTILSAVLFGLAIQIKLVPLLLLPFFLRFFGWKKSITYYTVTIIVVIGISLTLIGPDNILNFSQSLALYFRVFEFNAFIFYNYISIGELFVDYNPIQIIGPILSLATMVTIIVYALRLKPINWEQFMNRMMFGFYIYLILGSTMHPWYILPLLVLTLFTNYTFPILWSFLIFFTYFFYSFESGNLFIVRFLVSIEYIILFGYLFYEIKRKGSSFKFLRLDNHFHPKSEL